MPVLRSCSLIVALRGTPNGSTPPNVCDRPADIPLHDMSRDFVLLAEQRQAEADLKERFEKLSIELKEERERSDKLLYQVRNAARFAGLT